MSACRLFRNTAPYNLPTLRLPYVKICWLNTIPLDELDIAVDKYKIAIKLDWKIKDIYNSDRLTGRRLDAFLEILKEYISLCPLHSFKNKAIIIWLIRNRYPLNLINWEYCEYTTIRTFRFMKNSIMRLYDDRRCVSERLTTSLQLRPRIDYIRSMENMEKLNLLFPEEKYSFMIPGVFTHRHIDQLYRILSIGWSISNRVRLTTGALRSFNYSIDETTKVLKLLFEHRALYMLGSELVNIYSAPPTKHILSILTLFNDIKKMYPVYNFNSAEEYETDYLPMEINHSPVRYKYWLAAATFADR